MSMVIVLATPRTGSSMVAGVLHHLGVHMGDHMIAADRWNQQGYYEDKQFVGLHRVIGFAHGDADRARLNMPAAVPRLGDGLRARYVRVVRQRERKHALWGFKDPKYCFLHDQLAGCFAGDVKLVATTREVEESIASLMSMMGMVRSSASGVVGEYVERQRRVVAANPGRTFTVDYSSALASPGDVVDALADFVGVRPTPEAKGFINPALRRHSAAAVLDVGW